MNYLRAIIICSAFFAIAKLVGHFIPALSDLALFWGGMAYSTQLATEP